MSADPTLGSTVLHCFLTTIHFHFANSLGIGFAQYYIQHITSHQVLPYPPAYTTCCKVSASLNYIFVSATIFTHAHTHTHRGRFHGNFQVSISCFTHAKTLGRILVSLLTFLTTNQQLTENGGKETKIWRKGVIKYGLQKNLRGAPEENSKVK